MNKLTLTLLLTSSITVAQAITKEEAAKLPQFQSDGTPQSLLNRGGASTYSINFADKGPINTNATQGDPANIVSNCFSGVGGQVTGISWSNIVLQSFAGSWSSEVRIRVANSDDSNGANSQFAPGENNDNGELPFNAPDQALTAIGPVTENGDGIFNVEVFQSFNDGTPDPDGTINSGIVTYHGTGFAQNGTGNCALPVELMNFEVE